MDWNQLPQTDDDIADTYVSGDWVLRCLMATQDKHMWMLERRDRAPISQGDGVATLFLGIIWMDDFGEDKVMPLFEFASSLVENHKQSKH